MNFILLVLLSPTIFVKVCSNPDLCKSPESKNVEIEIELQYCGCKRKLSAVTNPKRENVSFQQTTCSTDAFRRGSHQKIVGFSLFGNYSEENLVTNVKGEKVPKGFVEGIQGNLDLMPIYYPGWVMRLYIGYDLDDPIVRKLCNLACKPKYSNLDICHVKQLPGTPHKDARKIFPMNWRFFPTLDPQVDLFVSRDLDSRFSNREHAAVEDWLKSNKAIHVMRDHPLHDFSMFGGLWGTKLLKKSIRSKWKKAWQSGQNETYMFSQYHEWGPDQTFLDEHVWPWAEPRSIGHDSYHCHHYLHTKAFPTKRELGPNNFVGAVVVKNIPLNYQCPIHCRPKNSLDWIYC